MIMEATEFQQPLKGQLGGQVITALASPGQPVGRQAEPVVQAIRALCLEVPHRRLAG